MFGKYYSSQEYTADFWRGQTMDNQYLKVMPAASFTETTMSSTRPLGRLMPVLIKAIPYEEVYGLVMLNPQRLEKAYGDAGKNPFYIMDAQDRLLFTTAETKLPALKYAGNTSSHERIGDNYYFYQKKGRRPASPTSGSPRLPPLRAGCAACDCCSPFCSLLRCWSAFCSPSCSATG
ncbi:hypothetical protein ACFTAO_22440 [Paenibacillus rhizoplanae]